MKVGNLVSLKSDGILMTVVMVSDCLIKDGVRRVWHDEDKHLQSSWFPRDALHIIGEKDKE